MRHALALCILAPVLGLSSSALAQSTSGTDELLSDLERVPPTVIFVLDRSADMASPCSAASTRSCWEDTVDAVAQVVRHFDFAQYGVVGTTDSASDDSFYRVAPVGSSYAEIASALSSTSYSSSSTRNFAEVLESLSDDYLSLGTPLDSTDNDGDGMIGDWTESPVAYSCSQTHVVFLGRDRPVDDDQVDWAASAALPSSGTNIACDASGTSSIDSECFYDNVVSDVYNSDLQASITDTQRIVVHTVGLGVSSGSLAESLYTNAEDSTAGEGVYTAADDPTEIIGAILAVMNEVQSGRYTRSTPVVSADGAYLLYSFYDIVADNPLAQGHIRAYALENDPTSTYYGQILYEGPTEYGGAVWDGGDLLVSRPVDHAEYNEEDRDGIGHRDIYTFEYNAYTLMSAEGSTDRRLGFDKEFVDNVGVSGTLDYYMDITESGAAAGYTSPWNLTYDDYGDNLVDQDDLQELVDFVRGWPLAEFKYLDMARGSWKLGDSPYAVPLLVSARNDTFTRDDSYRAFLEMLEGDNVPSIVLLPANDGMLHAFRLEDDPTTTSTDEAGQELWAWIPGYLLLREKNAEWANDLVDLVWYGRTFLFDATPVIEDVWIDDGDGTKAPDGSEWHRVVVVQQGLGGPGTLALDITDPQSPQYLWEQVNGQQLDGETMDPAEDATAMGYTMGRPAVFNVYDASGSPAADRWVAMWGGGQAVSFEGEAGTSYYESTEASLYMWNLGDDMWGSQSVGYSRLGDNVEFEMPDLSANGGAEGWADLDYDSTDANIERSYIASALAVVDVDGDGDGDVMYFPVTAAYRPTDEGGAGPTDTEVPGSSWIYKAILDTTDPDNLTWVQWYDPYDGSPGDSGSAIGARPEVFYAATAAWLQDGNLGIYWGTGTPFSREGSSNTGYFFAMYDANPTDPNSVAQPIPCYTDSTTANDGYYPLASGEGLTGEPIVYAGVVYFTTYTPNSDRCEVGTGKVYGLRYDDCSPGLDTDGSGTADWSDDAAITEDGYVSGITVTSMGTVMYGTSTPDGGMDQAGVGVIQGATNPFLGTAAIAWMEIY